MLGTSPAMSCSLPARYISMCNVRPTKALQCASVPSATVIGFQSACTIQDPSPPLSAEVRTPQGWKTTKWPLIRGYPHRRLAASVVTASADAESGSQLQGQASSLPSRPPSRLAKRTVVETARKRSKSTSASGSRRGRKNGESESSSSEEEAAIGNSDNGAVLAASESHLTQRGTRRPPSQFRHRSPIPAMLARSDGSTARTYWLRGEKASGFYKLIPGGTIAASDIASGRVVGSPRYQPLRPPSLFIRRSPLTAARAVAARQAAAGKEVRDAAARFQALVNRSLEARRGVVPARPPSAFKMRNRVRAMVRASQGRSATNQPAAVAAAAREGGTAAGTAPADGGMIASSPSPSPESTGDSPLLDRLLSLSSPPGSSDLSGLSGRQLQAVLKGRGVAGMWKMKKAELVEVALRELRVDWHERRHRGESHEQGA